MHLSKRLIEVIRSQRPNGFDNTRAETAILAALVHDLGHGPFSHAFEAVGKKMNLKLAKHEVVSEELILSPEVANILKRRGGGMPQDVANLIKGEQPDMYSAVVSSQFDADRLDYLQRDRFMTGTQTGAIDFEWLMANLQVADVPYEIDNEYVGTQTTFVVGPKAVSAAETYVLGLFQMYTNVYFHKTTRGAEKMFTQLLLRVFELVADNSVAATGLGENHPLIRFAREPESIGHALALDDTVIWGALSQLAESTDPVISKMAVGIRDRNLFKAIDIRVDVQRALGATVAEDDKAMVKICRAIADEIGSLNSNKILMDEYTRSPYKTVQESNGGLLNQIMVMTPAGKPEDLKKHSKVVDAIQPFTLMRAYHASDDDETKTQINNIIKTHIEQGANE